MATIRLTQRELNQKVRDIPYGENHIFHVVFIKRTTGERRKMTCRRGVKRHLRGGNLKYNAKRKNLLPVFDMEKGEYRSINCDAIIELTFDGNTYKLQEQVAS